MSGGEKQVNNEMLQVVLGAMQKMQKCDGIESNWQVWGTRSTWVSAHERLLRKKNMSQDVGDSRSLAGENVRQQFSRERGQEGQRSEGRL